MKKKMLLSLLLVCAASVPHMTWAQVSIGVRGGIVYSRPTTRPDFPSMFSVSETVNGPSVALAIEIRLTDRVSFLLEPGHVRKGMNLSWNHTVYELLDHSPWMRSYTAADPLTTAVDYVELPVLLKMSFLIGPLHPYIVAGSALAYKIKEKYTLTGIRDSDVSIFDIGFYSRYDVTFQVGAGMSHLIMDPVSVFADARYSVGLNNVDIFRQLGMKSREWRISGGIMVEL